MSLRLSPVLLLLLATPAALAGPFGLPIPIPGVPQMPDRSEEMKDGCTTQIQRFSEAHCTEKFFEFIGNEGRAGAMIADQGDAIVRNCSVVKSLADQVKEVETCSAKLRALSVEAVAAQEERLPAAKAKVPEIQADPKYTEIRGRYKSAKRTYDDAYARLEYAKKVNDFPPGVMQASADAQKAFEAVTLEFRAYFESKGVDYRDASKLGLF